MDERTPNIARMYDYFLGGSAHFESDRAAAQEFLRVYPGNTLWARHNRSFLGRAVRELCELGIDQFLDLGSGTPTVGNVHESAHRTNPGTRVTYVDVEPVAVSHAENMLRGTELATITRADMRRPEQALNAPGVAGLLDFTRPVAVLVVAILDIISVRDPRVMLATYRDACAPGSALAVANDAQLAMTDAERAGIYQVMSGTTIPHVTFHGPEEIRELFAGYTLLEPGVVPSAAWRPTEPVTDEAARHSNGYAAVGIRPS